MKLIYTHPAIIVVVQVKNLLERAGIACELRNEYAAGAAGELAPIDAWPELWLQRDRDLDYATALIQRSSHDPQESDWHCRNCGQDCPDSFDVCWHCAADRYAGP